MTSSTDFHKLSEDCVRRFLHSVVAVDDNMSFGAGSDTFPTDEDINALVDPDSIEIPSKIDNRFRSIIVSDSYKFWRTFTSSFYLYW